MSALFSIPAVLNQEYGAKELKIQIQKSTRFGFLISILLLSALYGTYKLVEVININTVHIVSVGGITLSDYKHTETIELPKPPIQQSSEPMKQLVGTKQIVGTFVGVNKESNIDLIAEFGKMNTASSLLGTQTQTPFEFTKDGNVSTLVKVGNVVETKKVVPEFQDLEKEVAFDLSDLQTTITYPPTPKMAGIEGTVIIQVLISEKGIPIQYKLLEENILFNSEAIKSVMNYRGFKPAIQNQNSVPAWITIPIKFKLNK